MVWFRVFNAEWRICLRCSLSVTSANAVILATGSTSIIPSKISRIKKKHVYTVENILSGDLVGWNLFRKIPKVSGFVSTSSDLQNFGEVYFMDQQEGVYMSYLTDPQVIAKILPPPLKPYPMPVVTISVCHVNKPTFADDYYEAILGVYHCTEKIWGYIR